MRVHVCGNDVYLADPGLPLLPTNNFAFPRCGDSLAEPETMTARVKRWHPLHTACIQGGFEQVRQVYMEMRSDPRLLSLKNAAGKTPN